MLSDGSLPSHRIAAQTLVYTLPIALGFVLLSWSVVELVSVFTDAYWVIPELLFALIVLTLGTGLTLFGSIGALSHSLHATIGTASESKYRGVRSVTDGTMLRSRCGVRS